MPEASFSVISYWRIHRWSLTVSSCFVSLKPACTRSPPPLLAVCCSIPASCIRTSTAGRVFVTWLQAPSRQAEVTVRVAFSWSVGTDHLTGTHQAVDRGTFSIMTLSVDGPMRSPLQGGFFPQLLLISPPLCSENPAWFWGPDPPQSPEWCQGSDGLTVGLLAAHRPPAWPGSPGFAVCLKS